MGTGGYSRKDWDTFSTSRGYHKASTTAKDIYRQSSIHEELDPRKFDYRESVDSEDNPNSTPIIVGLDVTGSMMPVLEAMAKKGMKTICEGIYERKPVTDPHICALGIGDVECDRAPLQATQFEADVRIFKHLEKIWLESGGGGNSHESYILAWYFAAYRTMVDSITKRGVKGSIFTMGDEEITPVIQKHHFERFLNDHQMRDITAQEMYDIVYPQWNIFHLIIKEGSHARYNYDHVYKSWVDVIGAQHVLPLDDHTKAGEVIVSTLELLSGKSLDNTAGSWDGSTGIIVKNALKDLDAHRAITRSLDSVL